MDFSSVYWTLVSKTVITVIIICKKHTIVTAVIPTVKSFKVIQKSLVLDIFMSINKVLDRARSTAIWVIVLFYFYISYACTKSNVLICL